MGSKLKILDASLKDASVLGDIQSQTWLDSYINQEFGITKADIQAKVTEWNQAGDERIQSAMNQIGAHTWIAIDDEKVVGFVAVLKNFEVNSIDALHVLPEYQKKGIGTKLLQTALEWLGKDQTIIIEVVAYNKKAQELYKKFGFKVIGEALNDPILLPSGKSIPKVQMVKYFYSQNS